MRQITPPVTLGRSLPNLALSASTAWPAVEAAAAAAAGGATAGAAGAVDRRRQDRGRQRRHRPGPRRRREADGAAAERRQEEEPRPAAPAAAGRRKTAPMLGRTTTASPAAPKRARARPRGRPPWSAGSPRTPAKSCRCRRHTACFLTENAANSSLRPGRPRHGTSWQTRMDLTTPLELTDRSCYFPTLATAPGDQNRNE